MAFKGQVTRLSELIADKITGALIQTRDVTAGHTRIAFFSDNASGGIDRIEFDSGRSDETNPGRLDVTPGTVVPFAPPSLLLIPPGIATDGSGEPFWRLTPALLTSAVGSFLNGLAELFTDELDIHANSINLLTQALRIGGGSGNTIAGLDFGATSVTTNASGDVTINHGAGANPKYIGLTSQTGTFLAFRISALNPVSFTCRVWNIQTGAVAASFGPFALEWLVIG